MYTSQKRSLMFQKSTSMAENVVNNLKWPTPRLTLIEQIPMIRLYCWNNKLKKAKRKSVKKAINDNNQQAQHIILWLLKATFNSISVKSVWSVLFLEETSSHLRTLSHEIIWDTPRQGQWNLNTEVCKDYRFSFLYKRQRKPKRQSRMESPETLEAQDTRMETNETNQK
jgi:hypothetical protein